jgi:hypothetical protein
MVYEAAVMKSMSWSAVIFSLFFFLIYFQAMGICYLV